MEEVAITPDENDAAASRVAASQNIVKDQTQKLLSSFLAKEELGLKKGSSETDRDLYNMSKDLVLTFLSDLDSMERDHLHHLAWLNPTLLTWCTRSKDQAIQKAMHDLLEKTSPASPMVHDLLEKTSPASPVRPQQEQAGATTPEEDNEDDGDKKGVASGSV